MVSSGLTLSLPSQVVNAGNENILSGDFASLSTAGPWGVTIDWGDGTSSSPDTTTMTLDASQTSFQSPAKQYAQSGSYTITVAAQDASGNFYAPVTQTVTVLGAPPQLTVAGSQTAVVGTDADGSQLGHLCRFARPVRRQLAYYSIDWGDGTDPDSGVIGTPGACGAVGNAGRQPRLRDGRPVHRHGADGRGQHGRGHGDV